MLSELQKDGLDDVVSWQPHGRCFRVHKQKRFVKEILPLWFRQSRYQSFQRQLNIYGFKRLTTGRDKGGYYSEFFLRSKRFLCARIQRVKVKGTKTRQASSPETEPNFYLAPFLPHDTNDTNEQGKVADTKKKSPPPPPPPSKLTQAQVVEPAPEPSNELRRSPTMAGLPGIPREASALPSLFASLPARPTPPASAIGDLSLLGGGPALRTSLLLNDQRNQLLNSESLLQDLYQKRLIELLLAERRQRLVPVLTATDASSLTSPINPLPVASPSPVAAGNTTDLSSCDTATLLDALRRRGQL